MTMPETTGNIPRYRVGPNLFMLIALAAAMTFLLLFTFDSFGKFIVYLPVFLAGALLVLTVVPTRANTAILFWFVALSIPFMHFAPIILAGQGIQWTHILGTFLIAHLVLRTIMGQPIRMTRTSFWMLGLLLATVLSTLNFLNKSEDHVSEFWKSEFQFVFGVLLFFAISQLKLSSRLILSVLKGMIVLSALLAAFGIYQLPARMFGWPGAVVRLSNPSIAASQVIFKLNFLRASSIFSEPSYFAFYLACMLGLSLPVALHYPGLFGKRIILWLLLAVQIAGLILSEAMAGYLLLAYLIVMMILVERGRARKNISVMAAAVLLLAVGGLFAAQALTGFPVVDILQARITGILAFLKGDISQLVMGESIVQRVDTTKVALRVWADHPIIGVGIGSYPLVSTQYGEWNWLGWAANAAVNTLVETGIIGFIALTGLAFSALYGLWRIFRKAPPENALAPEHREEYRFGLLISRMVFYLILVQVLYLPLGGCFFWPSTWFHFGLSALVTLHCGNIINTVRNTSRPDIRCASSG
jgi:O-antigen ligase